jgi:hypothetical protein
VEVSEDAGNITEKLIEAPNPSSEGFINISDPSPASEGKPRTQTYYFIYTAIYLYIYILVHYVLRSCLETVDASP